MHYPYNLEFKLLSGEYTDEDVREFVALTKRVFKENETVQKRVSAITKQINIMESEINFLLDKLE